MCREIADFRELEQGGGHSSIDTSDLALENDGYIYVHQFT